MVNIYIYFGVPKVPSPQQLWLDVFQDGPSWVAWSFGSWDWEFHTSMGVSVCLKLPWIPTALVDMVDEILVGMRRFLCKLCPWKKVCQNSVWTFPMCFWIFFFQAVHREVLWGTWPFFWGAEELHMFFRMAGSTAKKTRKVIFVDDGKTPQVDVY